MRNSNYNNSNLHKKYNQSIDSIYLKMNKKLNCKFTDFDINIANNSYSKEKSNIIFYKLYSITSDTFYFDYQTAIKKSIVMQLTKIIILNINLQSIELNVNNILGDNFYKSCLNNLSNNILTNSSNDNELVTLYLKQLIIILRNTDLLNNNNRFTAIPNSIINDIQMYLQMINSFWNESKWDELFPSMPEVAKSLNKNRNVLVDLMLKKNDRFKIADISNEFIKKTGLGKTNDLFLISFLDFTFFTWQYHFGIVTYINGADTDPVEIELTEHGRRILKYLLMQ